MEEHRCANCAEALPPRATYCLACDTPVSMEDLGLSVGESQVTQHGRPLLGVGVALGALLVIGGTVFGVLHLYTGNRDSGVDKTTVSAVRALIHVEAGRIGDCPTVVAGAAGDTKTVRDECRALVGTVTGAKLAHLHAVGTSINGTHGTVTLRGTWSDAQGKRPFERTVNVVRADNLWRWDWDGQTVTD